MRVQRHNFSYCRCGKVIFVDKVSADMALTRGAGRKGSIRSYECDVVPGNWHTTSKTLYLRSNGYDEHNEL